MKNRSLNHGIKCSSYEGMFETLNKIGLKSTSQPDSIIYRLKSDGDLEITLNSLETSKRLEKMLRNETKKIC